MAQLSRIKKELEMLATDPGPGVSCWPIDDDMTNLGAQIQGPDDSPYSEGTYSLSVQLPERYPFEPPRVRFLTPIYHPNIDSDGRICLDTLKMPPQGSWSPSININTLLLTVRMLMQQPNADDGLVPEITEEYKRNRGAWFSKAREHARRSAVVPVGAVTTSTSTTTTATATTTATTTSVAAGPSAPAAAAADTDTASGNQGQGVQLSGAKRPLQTPEPSSASVSDPDPAAPACGGDNNEPAADEALENEEEEDDDDEDDSFYVTDGPNSKRQK